jgi:plasmid stabilization system protein ParE
LKPVAVTRQAQTDIERAAEWYEARREGLGQEFVDRALEAIERIESHPESYAPVFRDARRVQLRQFTDYSLWFRVMPDNSLVVACMSGRRKPSLVKERGTGVLPIRPPEP